MLAYIKKALHYPSNETSFDEEITQHIDACKADLIRSGILSNKVIDTDAAIKNCVLAFCESRMSEINEREKYIRIYQMYKSELLSSVNYVGV